jgi:hypothetical protein
VLWKFKINGPSLHCWRDGWYSYISGCDETFRAIRIADGKEVFNVSSEAYRCLAGLMDQAAYFELSY